MSETFSNSKVEKGIAEPTTVNRGGHVRKFAPEDTNQYFLKSEDLAIMYANK